MPKHLRSCSYTIKSPVSARSHSAQKRHMGSLRSGWDPWSVLQSNVQCHLLPFLVTKQGPLMRSLLLSLYWFLSFSSLARSCWHVARASSKTWSLSSSSLSRSASCCVKAFPSGCQTGWDSARRRLLHSSSNLACSSSTCHRNGEKTCCCANSIKLTRLSLPHIHHVSYVSIYYVTLYSINR